MLPLPSREHERTRRRSREDDMRSRGLGLLRRRRKAKTEAGFASLHEEMQRPRELPTSDPEGVRRGAGRSLVAATKKRWRADP